MSEMNEKTCFFRGVAYQTGSGALGHQLGHPVENAALSSRPKLVHQKTLMPTMGPMIPIIHNNPNDDILYWINHPDEDDLPTPFASSFPEPPDYTCHSTLHVSIPNCDESDQAVVTDGTKGKGRAVVLESEEDVVTPPANMETSVDDGLNHAEKDEQSRRDAEWSLMLLAQELLEQGVPQEEIGTYVYQSQRFSPSPLSTLRPPFHSPKASGVLDDKLDLDRIAMLTVADVATRPLPPAYGPNYSPEPSTSQAGSPILAVRRASISSISSSASASSALSTSLSSTYTSEEEEELVAKMQTFLDECYEANKAAILSEVDRQERKRQRKTERAARKDGWRGWRYHLGILINDDDGVQLASGLDGNWIHGPTNLRFPTLSPLPIPDNMWNLDGGHRSAARDNAPQGGVPPQHRSNNSPASYFAPGTRYQGV